MKYQITYRLVTYRIHECEADSLVEARRLLERYSYYPVCEWEEVTETEITEVK